MLEIERRSQSAMHHLLQTLEMCFNTEIGSIAGAVHPSSARVAARLRPLKADALSQRREHPLLTG